MSAAVPVVVGLTGLAKELAYGQSREFRCRRADWSQFNDNEYKIGE
jgi:hypothetical protein